MYLQPYGDEQQLNLNWIISEIINLHKKLDPDYETPSFTQVYPYSNLNRLNLDWILSELKALKELAPGPAPGPALDIQAVAEALVALPFDSNTSYQIYDFISRDGEIWRATEAIAAGGEWDSSKWFKTKIGTDLAVLERWINTINNSLTAEIQARQDADTALRNTINALTSEDISDDSNAGGATVKESLDNLKGSLTTEIQTRQDADTALQNTIDALTSPVAVSTEAELLTSTKTIRTTANIALGNTGITIEAYARGIVISTDSANGCVLAVGYSGNVFAGYFTNGAFVQAQVYNNNSSPITLTANNTYISSVADIKCKRTGNIVAFSGTIVMGASATTNNILLSGFPAPSSAIDIFGTVIDATDDTLRGKTGRYRIKTDGTLTPWYNAWGATAEGNAVAFNTSYII